MLLGEKREIGRPWFFGLVNLLHQEGSCRKHGVCPPDIGPPDGWRSNIGSSFDQISVLDLV